MSGGANEGAYAGGGVYQAGGAGGGLHSLVTGFQDILRSHSAELTPGGATTSAAIDMKAAAPRVARRRVDNLMVGLPKGPSRP